MRNSLWRYGLYGVLIIAAIQGCRKPQAMEYLDVMNFKVDKLSMGQSVISADLKFYNPNNFRMQLKQAGMDISVNDNFLGHSELDTLMDIPKSDTFFIPVNLKVDMKTLITNSLAALLTNEVNVKLDGNAKVGKAGIFFNFPFSYEGKQKIKLF